jgi:hypothetical protein
MSNYKVLRDVGETLQDLIWSSFQNESEITPSIISDEEGVLLDPPFKFLGEAEGPTKNCLSIYLYRIFEDGDMKNRPQTIRADKQLEGPPLSLDLSYLITPITDNVSHDHLLLAKTMQLLYDNSILQGSLLKGVLADTGEELRVMLNPVSIEDMTRIWSGFMRPYRLSVFYTVKVIYIDSERQTETELIRRKQLEFSQVNGS